MSEPLKPQFWILRQNGSIVPLIAMDEMPHNIRVEGVSRTMNIKDTIGMVNVGEYPSRHWLHNVTDTNKSSSRLKHVPAQVSQVYKPDLDEEDLPSIATKEPVEIYPGSPKSYGIGERPPSDDEITEDSSRRQKSASKRASEAFDDFEQLPRWKDTTKLGSRLPAPGKKKYCSHWMSTGECDYAQQGCLYKHEMPFDLELLNHLGFQDIPKWYREKHGIGKLTATPGSSASFAGADPKHASRPGANRPARRAAPTPLHRDASKGNKTTWRGSKTTARSTKQADLLDLDQPEAGHRTSDTRQNNPLLASKFAVLQPASAIVKKPARQPQDQPQRGRLSRDNSIGKPASSTTAYPSQSESSERTTPSSTERQNDKQTPERRSYKMTYQRRSSVYSDPEADFIRENDERRKKQDEEYKIILKAKKAADELARIEANKEITSE